MRVEELMRRRGPHVIRELLITLAGILALASTPLHVSAAPAPSGPQTAPHWDKVSVTLPVSTTLFPAGEGAATANSQCLTCHSVAMVLSQPVRTEAQWKETINKMRTAYGAPLPVEQVDALAAYLVRVLGHDARGG
jgi:cytochrome c5